MNRYSYVQGNPLSYTDPFGLCPIMTEQSWLMVHCVLELVGCIPGPVGFIANGINAVIYALVDHDALSALMSLFACITCGASSIASNVAKTAKGIQTAQMVEYIAGLIYHGFEMAVSGRSLGRACDAIQQKKANGEEVTLSDWAAVVMSGISMTCSAVSMLEIGGKLGSGRNACQIAKTAESDSAVVKGGQQLASEGQDVIQGIERGSKTINPNEIRFSQSSVNGASEIIDSMKLKGWDGEPIDVVVMPDGNFTTIDNTRVLAARYAEIDVQANVHAFDELLSQDIGLIERFTTPKGVPQTWGDAVLLRIGKQNSGYRNTYPLGSNIIGWSGN